jgi:hypothetical protein
VQRQAVRFQNAASPHIAAILPAENSASTDMKSFNLCPSDSVPLGGFDDNALETAVACL